MYDYGGKGEADLVVGTIRGVRAWDYAGGRLVAPFKRRLSPPWKNGENVSECLPIPFLMDLYRDLKWGGGTDHIFDCVCGFYACYDEQDFEHRERVRLYGIEGVIEGYGKTTVGTLGFRCEKAKIVALTPVRYGWMGWFAGVHKFILFAHWRLKRNYPDAEVFRSRKKMYRKYPVTRPSMVDWRS